MTDDTKQSISIGVTVTGIFTFIALVLPWVIEGLDWYWTYVHEYLKH